MDEDAGTARRRMAMRAWRRGTREMDLILGPWADARLEVMDGATLALFDALLDENDQDLLPWVLGQHPAPERFAGLVARIAAFAHERRHVASGDAG